MSSPPPRGAQRPSSVTTAQSIQNYDAFGDKFVHEKQAKSIVDKDYLKAT